jgi:hypothetical protein
MRLSRRALLACTAALPFASSARAADPVSIRIDPSRRLRAIPSNYMGLGYEASSVAMGILSADNHPYVQLVRNLGRDGVIRIGGNVSDFAFYDADGTSKWEPKDTVLTLANIRQLRSFLDATGWKLIWGLNLGGDRLDNAVDEARAVAQVMGDKLLALEIGNEPDLFTRSGHRTGNYDYQAWARDYRRYKSAVRAVLPRVPFAGPDIAFRTEWLESFSRDEGGDIAMLTAHHYIMGQADPATTIELMLQEEKKYQPALAKFQAAAQAAHVPWRMCETQSFSGGGRAGVSDTFASALWALDYLFVLAGYGCSGVNMETGVNHLGWVSKYTPITGAPPGPYAPAPEYYGLLAFAQAARGEQIAAVTNTGGINLTAYATRQGGDTVVTVINKDATQGASVEISGIASRQASVMRLTGPSLAATSGASLGGAVLAADGTWSRGKSDAVRIAGGKALLDVPAGSAALISLQT